MAKGQAVNRQGLADVFGVSLNTVSAWVRDGCPVVQRGAQGKPWEFNTAAVADWLRQKERERAAGDLPDDAERLELRKQAAITGKHELEYAKARAMVIPLDQMERAVANAFAEIKINLRNIPSRVVSALIGETDERRFKETLLAEIDQALDGLADADLVGLEDEGEALEGEGE